MSFLDCCVQHVPKIPRSMLQPRVFEVLVLAEPFGNFLEGRTKKRVFRASLGLSYSIFVALFTLTRKVY